jgi:hypothetical protein
MGKTAHYKETTTVKKRERNQEERRTQNCKTTRKGKRKDNTNI